MGTTPPRNPSRVGRRVLIAAARTVSLLLLCLGLVLAAISVAALTIGRPEKVGVAWWLLGTGTALAVAAWVTDAWADRAETAKAEDGVCNGFEVVPFADTIDERQDGAADA